MYLGIINGSVDWIFIKSTEFKMEPCCGEANVLCLLSNYAGSFLPPPYSQSTLCSRNFQNVKLMPDFVELWLFYRHSDFTWNQILAHSNGKKMSFLAYFRDSELWILVNLGLENFRTSKIAKNDIFGPFVFTKIWCHVKSEWR